MAVFAAWGDCDKSHRKLVLNPLPATDDPQQTCFERRLDNKIVRNEK